MFLGATKTRVVVTAAIAAMWLTACGGGGGDDVAAAPTPPPAAGGGGNPPAPAPAQALAWTPTSVQQINHWTATSADGQVMLAGGLPGTLFLSTDGGANWAPAPGLPVGDPGGRWISADISADGQHMVAAAFDGAVWRSSDGGATWAQIDQSFNTTGVLPYESVTISNDGQRIVAALGGPGGPLRVTTNGGTSWTTATSGGAALTGSWRAVDSSADGAIVAAANHEGQLFISTDAGATFTGLAVTVDGAAVADGWYRLAMSRDGSTIALAGNQQWGIGVPLATRSTGLYVGQNQAGTWTWNRGSQVIGNYGAIAMSANGDVIGASLYAPTDATGALGQVLISSNHGQSFAPVTVPTGEVDFRALAMTAAGDRLVLGTGDFAFNNFAGAQGTVYTSTGSVTGQ
jgi:hypothetical protein